MAKLGTIIADFRTALSAKMTVGATTGTLQSATDDDGVALPTGRYFFTIDGDNSQKEHISCELSGTDLTSIKSVSRQGVETSGTVREHRVGASVVITNFAHIRYLNDMVGGDLIWDTPDLTGIKSITGTDAGGLDNFTFVDGLTTPNSSETTKAANVEYVNNITLAGAADASATVKGITKLSTAPASPTEPIACGTNDPRLPTTDEKAAMVGTSGTPSTSNKFITADDATATPTANKIARADANGNLDNWVADLLFGNGIDGDVVISTNTSLSADMSYNNLTINNGIVLNTNGYRIFVKNNLINNGTISNSGTNASTYNGGSGGATGTLSGGASGGNGGYKSSVEYAGGGGGGGGIVMLSAKNIIVEGNITANGGDGASAAFISSGGTATANTTAGNNIANSIVQADGGTGGGVSNPGVVSAIKKINENNPIILLPFIDSIGIVTLGGGAGGGGGRYSSSDNDRGGGGGGGGGIIVEIFKNRTTTGTVTANGGNGGLKVNNGVNGSNGSNGKVIQIDV